MIRSAASGVRATVAPPPHGARITNASIAPSPFDEDPRRLGRGEPGDRVARSSPVPVAVERDHAWRGRRAGRLERQSRGIGRAGARRPGGSGTASGPRSPSARTAGGPRSSRRARASRQPAPSSRPMIDWVIARPRPRAAPRGLHEDRADPADRAVRRPDARGDDRRRPPRRRSGKQSGCVVANSSQSRRTPQSLRRIISVAGSTSAGAPSAAGMASSSPFSIIRRWPDSPARTSSTSRSSRASA